MEGGEGMMAVVRGLRDSGLAVTLMDGCRQYTLMPNAGKNHPHPPNTHGTPQPQGYPQQIPQTVAHPPMTSPQPAQHQISQQPTMSSMSGGDPACMCDSASQATDGRYVSMYKTAHCRVSPTSPPVELTEFPPQRPELCRGHGNFVVGGSGSGENYVSCQSNGSFRGGMSWPDRGSVCSPRPSREPDAFAKSLRKYPNLAMERSTEMVERLITYTQAKNQSKGYQNRYPSSRNILDQHSSNQLVMDRNMTRNNAWRSCSYQKSYEEVTSKTNTRLEESPTRDMRPNDCECSEYRKMMNAAKGKENIRSLSYTVPYHQPVIPGINERYEVNAMLGQATPPLLTTRNSVNMEVQAAAEMVSREVATVPKTEPLKRTVAVPLSRASSSVDQKRGDVSDNLPTYKSVETSSMPVDFSVQTASNMDSKPNPNHQCRCLIVERKSKSEEKLNVEKQFSEEILELLDKVSVCPNADPSACDLRREVLKEMSEKLQKMSEYVEANGTNETNKDGIENMLKYVPIWVPCGDVQSYKEAVSNEIINKMNSYNSYQVYRAETHFRMRTEDSDLEHLLNTLIGGMPVKTMDIFGKPIEKNFIVETYVKRVKRLIMNVINKADTDILKAEILVVLSKIPIAISRHNKIVYLNKVVDSLMNKLKNISHSTDNQDRAMNSYESPKVEKIRIENIQLKKYVQPTEEELRDYVSQELKLLLDKSSCHVANVKDVETDIIDLLIDSINDIRLGKETNLADEIMLSLLQGVDNLPENRARTFTSRILETLRKRLNLNEADYALIANQVIGHLDFIEENQTNCDLNNTMDFDSGNLTEKVEIYANIETYMNQLIQQIDEWLNNLNIKTPQVQDPGFREVIVNDLAGDIVDRRKYIELNPSNRGNQEDDIEHLKYQIFKWINKLAGENNKETIRKASDLMRKIQSIPVPKLSYDGSKLTDCVDTFDIEFKRSNNIDGFKIIPKCKLEANTSRILVCTNKSNNRSSQINQAEGMTGENVSAACCSISLLKPFSPSTKKLNEDYDAFLKQWVQQIPIPSNTSKEKAIADKARMGIYNGIWKAITKLKFEPATFHNTFYYEDALDDEIEELFKLLPKTPELDFNKHLLKVQLIEKTTKTNDMIKLSSGPASFKQKLVESVYKSLPHINDVDEDVENSKQSFEKLKIWKIVDNFILCSKYKEEDSIKANVYRKKLVKLVKTLLDDMKKEHNEELKAIDPDLYTNRVLSALQKVPLPDEETIHDEANQIILGKEVEQWFSDIILEENFDVREHLKRKILKDELVKKIFELEKEVNIFDCSGEKALRHEVSAFLQKLPLDETENISFMAEELYNRLKNRSRLEQFSERYKSGTFLDSPGYYEFSQQLPHCSSYSKIPGGRPVAREQSSYMIRGGSIVKDEYGYIPQNQTAESREPIPSDQYFTMEDSQAPKIASRRIQPQQNIDRSPEFVPPNSNVGSMERQKSPCCRNAIISPPNSVSHELKLTTTSGNTSSNRQSVDWHSLPIASSITQEPSDRLFSPCCQNSSLRHQSYNNSRQSLSMSSKPLSPEHRNDMPPIFESPGIVRELSNPSNSPPRQRPCTPMPDVVDTNHGQASCRDAEISIHQNIRKLSVPNNFGVREMNMEEGMPSMSYGPPQGYSTPQQRIMESSPPRPRRKKGRTSQRNRRDFARRRLELEDSDLESGEERCQCMETMFRRRKRPVCFAYDECEVDEPHCYPFPLPYGCPYFY